MTNPYESPNRNVGGPPTTAGGTSFQSTVYDRGMTGQVRVVAILMMVQGVLEMLTGLFFCALAALMPFMISKQMAANPAMQRGPNGPPPEEMFWIMIAAYGGMGLAALVPGLLHILAGWRNYQFRNRQLGIVALGFGLITIGSCYCVPTALALTIYGLIVYLNGPVAAAFQSVKDGGTVDSVLAQHYQFRAPHG